MTDVEVAAEWTPLDDLVALHTAGDADELHRRLLLSSDAGGSPGDAFEPWCLLSHFHDDDPDGAIDTAMLLLTDRRWRNATGRLIRRIEDSELVPADHLELLAQTFLAADAQVYWEAPGDWFGGPAIVIDLGQGGADDDEPDSEEAGDDASDRSVVFARKVRPPLRRWAAGRVVRADPASWGALVKRAQELDARSAAAIVRGILDGIDGLTPAAQAMVVKLALGWPHRAVREAAADLADRAAPTSPLTASTAPRRPERAAPQLSLF